MDKAKANSVVRLEKYFRRHPPPAGQPAVIDIPFVCDHCWNERFILAMIDGDGLLVCEVCFEGYVSILEPKRINK